VKLEKKELESRLLAEQQTKAKEEVKVSTESIFALA